MVDYCLSGAVTARVDGVQVALGGPKQRCVLAVLLANQGTVVGLERVIDEVWDGDPPAKALASVRSYVANLRRILAGAQRLLSLPHGYQLNVLPDDTVDLVQFEELVATGRAALVRGDCRHALEVLTRALTLWRGEPFGEFADRGFAAADVVRYAALRTTAVEARFDAALQAGGGAELIPDIEAAVTEHPLQERLWAHLMVALYRADRTADAFKAYDRARVTLDRELGTRPGEGLRTLYRKINEGSDDLRAQPQRATESPAAPIPLVGRTSELAAIDAVVQRAARGIGGLTLVTGESGIGKTSLAQAASDRARAAGVAVAWARHPAGVTVPTQWTWIQLLRQLGAELGPEACEAVRRAAPGVVDALVPEWHTSAVTRLPATGFALREGIVTALSVLAGIRPVLVVIDDLQRASPAAFSTFALLASQLVRMPLQVIGTWTYFGSDRPMNRSAFDQLMGSHDTTSVRLHGIDAEATSALLEWVTGAVVAPATAGHLWQQARGNPFYLRELGRNLAAGSVPDAIVGVVARRLDELDGLCRRIVSAAAVLGPEFDAVDLADVVDLPISTVQAQLRTAYHRGLLDEVPDWPGAYRFSHGLVHEAVLSQLDTADRTGVHAAVAATRAPAVTTAAYEDAISAADHAWRAGAELHPEMAVGIHEAAIGRALARSAYHDVVGLVEHALQISGRLAVSPDVLERQGTLWLHLASAQGILEGQTSRSAAHALQRVFEIGQQLRGRHYYGAIALQALMKCAYGHGDEIGVLATGLQEQYQKSGDPDAGVVADFVQILVHYLRGNMDALIATGNHMMATFPPPETVTDPLHFFHPRVLSWMALAEASRGNYDAMVECCDGALQLAQSRGDVFNILVAKLAYVEGAAIMGIVEGIADLADAVDREFCAAGSEQWAATARIVSVWARFLHDGSGDPAVAFDAYEIYTCDGSVVAAPLYLALLSDIERQAGRLDSAHALLVRAGALADAAGEHSMDQMIADRLATLDQPLSSAATRSSGVARTRSSDTASVPGRITSGSAKSR